MARWPATFRASPTGANRLSRTRSRASLFVAGAARCCPPFTPYDDRELEPTRYFLPR